LQSIVLQLVQVQGVSGK